MYNFPARYTMFKAFDLGGTYLALPLNFHSAARVLRAFHLANRFQRGLP
jgi:hypothetical protein